LAVDLDLAGLSFLNRQDEMRLAANEAQVAP
jgi:hypothetical protein